ncbi:type IV pilus biogenesis/stability protein PilW [Rheinheimera salexigens]|uniref:Type IV pilus biogenesis/stability protein PilW n=2 Tax=Rheinheimera salexigens TaxID=1628148 RepID=A0A1E7Q9T2_9GAMM|nr:type IV pilus biogenesis/stability protein PilW [Rheinheimera salexigens]
MLAGCVSEQTYVGSEKPVASRTFDNIEAARTRISLGLNYLRRGDNSEAKYNLERARSFAPNSAEVYSALAYYYENVSEIDQAEEHYLIAIDKDPNYADAYNNYGAFLCQLHKYEESERLLLKAISRPGYIRVAESYENLALCQLQQNNFRKTKTYLESSINHSSTRISSLVLASGLSYAMGEMAEAKNRLARIQRLGRVTARTVLLSYLIADKSGDTSTKDNAEQLLLTLYMGSAETTLLLQDKLALSEFELLRERYKETLMSNIVIPTETTSNKVIPQPVANPKLKIVRRKNSSTDQAESADVIALSPQLASVQNSQTDAAVVTIATPAATLPGLKNATSAIANSLELGSSVTSSSVPRNSVANSSETNSAVNSNVATSSKAEAEVAITKPEASPVNEMTVITSQQLAALKAKQAAELGQPLDVKPKSAQTETAPIATAKVANQPAIVTKPEQLTTTDAAKQKAVSSITLAAKPVAALPSETLHLEPETNQNTPLEATVASLKFAPELASQLTSEHAAEPALETIAVAAITDVEPTATELTDIEPAESNAKNVTAEDKEFSYHLVQADDSLYAISVKYNIRLQRLMEWNQLTPESAILTGQKIWLQQVPEQQVMSSVKNNANLPIASRIQVTTTEPYHQVAAGETMFAISYRYNIKLDKFMAWNNLTDQSKLYIGQQLLVVDPALIAP